MANASVICTDKTGTLTRNVISLVAGSIGAGHSSLEIAARLKYIGVPTLIIDKKPRVGDNVRPFSISVNCSSRTVL